MNVQISEPTVEGCAVLNTRFNMTPSEREIASNKLMAYDMPHVEYRLRTEARVPKELIPQAMSEWRRFMTCILYSDGNLGMISPLVDEVWHANILFTKEYATFCQDVYGRQINHMPNWPGAPLGTNGGKRFIATYEELYGNLPAIWTQHRSDPVACDMKGPSGCSGCGDCDGDDECEDDACSVAAV